jgi:hypothetical protein
MCRCAYNREECCIFIFKKKVMAIELGFFMQIFCDLQVSLQMLGGILLKLCTKKDLNV